MVLLHYANSLGGKCNQCNIIFYCIVDIMTSILRSNASTKYNTTDRPFLGDTKTSAIKTDHAGWLLCDGRDLNKNVYSLLFREIGYTFGGSGELFKLPDARGRVTAAIGPDGNNIGGDQIWVQGAIAGTQRETIDISEMPSHTHDISTATTGITINSAGAHTHTLNINATDDSNFSAQDGQYPAADGNLTVNTVQTATDGIHTHSITDPGHTHVAAHTGGNVPINIMQPTIFIGNTFMYCGLVGPSGRYLHRSTQRFV